jgi:threonine aldolase
LSIIDLRSDTVTKPSDAMRKAMYEAKVGDDVYGDDPTVNKLQELAADLLKTEAALFVCSGTQSNLLALMSHCQRGDEYIVGQSAHTYKYEAGGAAVLGSIQPQPLDFEVDGTLDLKKVKAAIKPKDSHFANTRLFCLENTNSGKVLPMAYLKEAMQLARETNLGFHLDGARLFNASVKLKIEASEISRLFDTTSICLSKGLGAPVGSVLCGKTELIKSARRLRKMVGGGMRQAGILAAAGIVGLTQNVERLEVDHSNALLLAKGLCDISEIKVDLSLVETNMVFLELGDINPKALETHLKKRGILISADKTTRLVTHLDVSEKDISTLISAIKEYLAL